MGPGHWSWANSVTGSLVDNIMGNYQTRNNTSKPCIQFGRLGTTVHLPELKINTFDNIFKLNIYFINLLF